MTETELRNEVLFWEVERWRALQVELLAKHVKWCAERSGLYRGRGIVVEGGLRGLPVTTKDEVAAAGSAAFAIAAEEVREWVCTSGTAGRALDVPLSAGDLARLGENEAVALGLAGVGQGDVLLLGVGMDRMFVAGLAYWLGGQKLGTSCVRVGPNLAMVEGIGARLGKGRKVFLVAVPSFLIAAPVPAEPLAGIIAIGEAVRNADLSYNMLGRKLAERFGCPVMSTYASTETCTTFAEGPTCLGGHLNPALGIVELLDDAGTVVKEGEVGELVVTPLGVEGLPLLRFRTGDMAAIFLGKCACGRTTPRVGPIVGRRQQLLKLRGTSVYPGAILEVLRAMEEVADCVIVAERDAMGGDRAIVYAEARVDSAAIETRLQAGLRVRLEVRVVSDAQLAELRGSAGGRKVRRFLDRRI